MYQYVHVEGPWEGTQELFFRHKQTTTLSETTTITKARRPSGIHISKHLKGQLGMKSAQKWRNISKYICDLTNRSLLIAE